MSRAPDSAFRPSPAYRELDLTPFHPLPPAVWSPEQYAAQALIDALVDRACQTVLEEMCGPIEGICGPAAQLLEEAAIASTRVWSFEWLLERLRVAGLLSRTGDCFQPGPTRAWGSQALDAASTGWEGRLGSTLELIELARERFPGYLRGGDGFRLGPASARLWARYFHNDNLAYAVMNQLGAYAVEQCLATGRPVDVLEVGGGLGSAAETVLERVGTQLESYHFTELVPFFLRQAEGRLAEGFPGLPLRFGRLDFNRPLSEQGLAEHRFDLVYAVNALHVASHLQETLRQLGGVLQEGGMLVLAEEIRPGPGYPVAIEFVLQLMPGFHQVVLDPACRSTPGFLHAGEWTDLLCRSGFTRPRFLPELGAAVGVHPQMSMAAILAGKAGDTL